MPDEERWVAINRTNPFQWELWKSDAELVWGLYILGARNAEEAE